MRDEDEPLASFTTSLKADCGSQKVALRSYGLMEDVIVSGRKPASGDPRIASKTTRAEEVQMTDVAQRQELEQTVPLTALFTAFLAVPLYGVGGGGGIVWARRITVEKRRWISDSEFADIVSLCQFMPGPNIVGIAVCVGAKMRGTIGTIAAVSGFLVIPWIIGVPVGLLFLE